MNEFGWRPMRRLVVWGLVGLFVLVGISIALSWLFFSVRPVGTFYPFFPFGWFGGLFLFFLILVWVARWIFWPWRYAWGPHGHRPDAAFQILRERYARGEITKEQYDQMARDLPQHG